jgi:hypothetical protein
VTKPDQQAACHKKPALDLENFRLPSAAARQKNPRGQICRAIAAFLNRPAGAKPQRIINDFGPPSPRSPRRQWLTLING